MIRDAAHWGEAILPRLKRSWPLIVLCALLGALGAGIVAATAPYTATASLLLRIRAFDNTAMERAAQSALEEMSAPSVFEAAAKNLNVTRPSLEAHTTLAASAKSLVLTVQVADDNQARAVAGANAVANAAVSAAKARRDGELTRLREATIELIGEAPLRGAAAETARVQKLAEGLAANQSNVLGEYGRLELLQSADATSTTRTPMSTLVVLGLAGGTALGVALALAFAGSTGRIADGSQLRGLIPQAQLLRPGDLPTVLALANPQYRVIAVAEDTNPGAVPRPGQVPLADQVAQQLAMAGYDLTARSLHGEELAALPRQDLTSSHPSHSVQVISCPVTPVVLSRVSSDPGVLVIMAIEPKVTRLRDIDRLVPYLTDRTVFMMNRSVQASPRSQQRAHVGARV